MGTSTMSLKKHRVPKAKFCPHKLSVPGIHTNTHIPSHLIGEDTKQVCSYQVRDTGRKEGHTCSTENTPVREKGVSVQRKLVFSVRSHQAAILMNTWSAASRWVALVPRWRRPCWRNTENLRIKNNKRILTGNQVLVLGVLQAQ